MTLFQALIQSENSIATRRRVVMNTKNKPKYEYIFATVDHRGKVHICNGRNGTIRREAEEDRIRTDWEPFAPSRMEKFKPRKAPPEDIDISRLLEQ